MSIEVRVLFSSRGCSHPGLELYHWLPTCQVMDVKLLKCLCPCEQQTSNGELLSGTASEKQRSSRAGGSGFSYQAALPLTQTLPSSYITTTIIITETSRRQACIACCHSLPCSPFS